MQDLHGDVLPRVTGSSAEIVSNDKLLHFSGENGRFREREKIRQNCGEVWTIIETLGLFCGSCED